jgi:hypothetical protein
MKTHRFAVGDKVIVQADTSRPSVPGGLYIITQPLPIDALSGQTHYRVKNKAGSNELVVEEAWMRPADRW